MLPNVVVGGGIIGLAVANELCEREPQRPVVVLEKEAALAQHQTGHNSGVIHSGLYYAPGSLKARLAVQGAEELKRFCDHHGIKYDVPGKLVVATSEEHLPQIERLLRVGMANGVPVRVATRDEIREREPAISVKAALIVDSTGRVDYKQVAAALAQGLVDNGGEVQTGRSVRRIVSRPDGVVVELRDGDLAASRAVVCAGLHADQLARASGLELDVRILPFRGEYAQIEPPKSELVRGLVYPVPDPHLPFLGVHLTRGIDGNVHVGPNAVPAFAREGYRWSDIAPRDMLNAVAFPGSWRLARTYGRIGLSELRRSMTGRALARAAADILPGLSATDLVRAGAGVRAQAVTRSGQLVDDFLFRRDGRALHVLNAPSPAATASIPIARLIADELLGRRDTACGRDDFDDH